MRKRIRPASGWATTRTEIVVRRADVEGLRTGIVQPVFLRRSGGNRHRVRARLLIEHSRFKNYFGVVVGTAYASTQRRATR